MNSVNWPRLVETNRAKAIGVPWSDADLKAIASGVHPDHVRKGILTAADSAKEQKVENKQTEKTGEKPIGRMNLEELKVKATELGLEFTPEASKASLKEIINAHIEAEGGDTEAGDNA